jgi:hypothetical protein
VAGATIALYVAIPPRLTHIKSFFYDHAEEVSDPRKNRDTSNPIVIAPMMPSVPPIFIRVTIMAVAPGVIVI